MAHTDDGANERSIFAHIVHCFTVRVVLNRPKYTMVLFCFFLFLLVSSLIFLLLSVVKILVSEWSLFCQRLHGLDGAVPPHPFPEYSRVAKAWTMHSGGTAQDSGSAKPPASSDAATQTSQSFLILKSAMENWFVESLYSPI